MTSKKDIKKPAKKLAVKPLAANKVKTELKPETLIGKSSDFSFKKALKDALRQASKLPADYCKYEVVKIEYEKGGTAGVSNLLVTIKRVMP